MYICQNSHSEANNVCNVIRFVTEAYICNYTSELKPMHVQTISRLLLMYIHSMTHVSKFVLLHTVRRQHKNSTTFY